MSLAPLLVLAMLSQSAAHDRCNEGFWRSLLENHNTSQVAAEEAMRTVTILRTRVDKWRRAGGGGTLAAVLALLAYESNGQLGYANTRCGENSYDRGRMCWTNPEARYSYQLGIGAIHTSVFHPCKDVRYTRRRRAHANAILHKL